LFDPFRPADWTERWSGRVGSRKPDQRL